MTIKEQRDNKFLFSWMKDNESWRTEHRLDHCSYHNPLNSSVYGLLFHKDEHWLTAVENKLKYRIIDSGFSYHNSIAKGIDSEGKEYYCMLIETKHRHELYPITLAHVHNYNYLEGKRDLLVLAIKNLLGTNRVN